MSELKLQSGLSHRELVDAMRYAIEAKLIPTAHRYEQCIEAIEQLRSEMTRLESWQESMEKQKSALNDDWFKDVIFELRQSDPSVGLLSARNDEDIAFGIAEAIKDHFSEDSTPSPLPGEPT